MPVKPLWWRSVGNTHTAYVMETLMDELAAAAGQDPLDYRLGLLKNSARAAGVLKLAAQKARWGRPARAGTAQGIAMHHSFGSFVAQVADVSMKNGKVKVERVVCAVDCGVAVNPDVIRAQMEGGIHEMPKIEVYIVDSKVAPTGVGDAWPAAPCTGGGECGGSAWRASGAAAAVRSGRSGSGLKGRAPAPSE